MMVRHALYLSSVFSVGVTAMEFECSGPQTFFLTLAWACSFAAILSALEDRR